MQVHSGEAFPPDSPREGGAQGNGGLEDPQVRHVRLLRQEGWTGDGAQEEGAREGQAV